MLKNQSPEIFLTPVNTGSIPKYSPERDINDLRRELRCSDCKRLTCLGNCAPGQEYHQYKRIVCPSSPLMITRDQLIRPNPKVLTNRATRSVTQVRPRSRQQSINENKYKLVSPSTIQPIVIFPVVQTDSSNSKHSSKK